MWFWLVIICPANASFELLFHLRSLDDWLYHLLFISLSLFPLCIKKSRYDHWFTVWDLVSHESLVLRLLCDVKTLCFTFQLVLPVYCLSRCSQAQERLCLKPLSDWNSSIFTSGGSAPNYLCLANKTGQRWSSVQWWDVCDSWYEDRRTHILCTCLGRYWAT